MAGNTDVAETVPLHPRDRNILTAKAVAYRAIVRCERRLFVTKGGSEKLPLRVSVLKLLDTLDTFDITDSHSEVTRFMSAMETTLGTVLPAFFSDVSVLQGFLTTFRQEADTYPSIEKEIESWLAAFLAHAKQQPAVNRLGVPTIEASMVDFASSFLGSNGVALAGVTYSVSNSRKISILARPELFDFSSYFTLGYVISHEFWAHALSKLDCSTWVGADPQDAWEEGWMDFVQYNILRSVKFQLPTCFPQFLAPTMERECSIYGHIRANPANGIQRSYGWSSAASALRFLRQYFPAFAPDELMLSLSLELNCVGNNADMRMGVMNLFKKHLDPPDDGSDLKSMDRDMLGLRTDLFRLLQSCIVCSDELFLFDIERLRQLC